MIIITRAFVEIGGVFFPAEPCEGKLVVSMAGDALTLEEAKKVLLSRRMPGDNELNSDEPEMMVEDREGELHRAIMLDRFEQPPREMEFARDKFSSGLPNWLSRLFRRAYPR